MGLVLSPKFTEIFSEQKPSIEELLSGISSIGIMGNLAAANSMIDANYDQHEILKIFLRRQSLEIFKPILYKINQYHKKVHPVEWVLFTKLYISQLMIKICEFGNELKQDTTPEQELQLFKAYLLAIEDFQEKQENIEFNYEEGNSFNNLTWSIFSNQFEFNYDPFILFQIVKAYTLIDELYKDEEKRKYLKTFSELINIPLKNYIGLLTEIITTREKTDFNGLMVPQFFILIEENQSKFLDHLSIDFNEIRNEPRFNHNYYALKKYPLAKIKKGCFIVLNWTFLKAKLYEGFLFDFYYNSGIQEIYPKFPDFKSFVGSKVFEQRIFKATMQSLFNKKHHHMHFDIDDSGDPDLYLRINNRVFLFEFKDSMVASKVSASESYDVVKKELIKKFIKNEKGRPKGITQLVNHIKILKERSFDFDQLSDKARLKLEIYPILVYTDYFYSMPGINKFLIEEFGKILGMHSFKYVENPVLIDILYLIRNLNFLEGVRLDKLIKHYFKKIKEIEKRSKKKLDMNLWITSNMSFDMIGPTDGMKKPKDLFNVLLEKLELKIVE